MITIEFTRNGQSGSRKVHTFALESTLANYRAAGYTITSDGSAPVAAPVVKVTGETGRVGKGREIHRIVGGGAACGSSYRKGLNANSIVKVTGEDVTCSHCKAI